MNNLFEQIDSFFVALNAAYSRQGPAGKILIGTLVLMLFCCLCAIPMVLLPLRRSPIVAPGPVVLPTQGTQASATALPDPGLATMTPSPTTTSFVPTPFPTLTPLPTGSPTAISSTTLTPSPTLTPLPTDTAPPTATEPSGPVIIIAVDKEAEYAEIRNISPEEVNLRGWRLVSEIGNQSCGLRGTLAPGEVLRIWARRGEPGFDCRLGREIWMDNEVDPAVLYNRDGQEVSRFP